jgi:tRNA threonylcarbamoyladenosine biosynthesis protein TsaE
MEAVGGAAGPPRRVVRRATRSARATADLGARLGRALAPGDVVALVGELGTGKTQLVRGACRGAGVPAREVSSPSFAIVATYRGRLPVHHADLYRIADEEELYATGFQDLLGGEGALLVEWADRVPRALPGERLEVRLAHDARRPRVRHLLIVGTGRRHAELAQVLAPPRRPPASTKRRRGAPDRTRRVRRAPAAPSRAGRRPSRTAAAPG